MEKYSSIKIRQMWMDFWSKKDHEIMLSKSLIPVNDPSLLWVNSGVATLKDFFSGKKLPKNPRIANSQKSLRTNDIENVGITSRHHTLFEMLGNFSIGDYFKKEAIEWAWEFLTKELKFSPSKLFITYYEEDLETYDFWIKQGVDSNHLIKGNRETNFWDIGEGPCGPDTEIFYDRGELFDPEKIGLQLLKDDAENDRYIEIWNIVFSQFNHGSDDSYAELKQKNIDTGAGLERIVSILQDGPTNFDTDLFLPIIHFIETLTDKKYDGSNYFKKDKAITQTNKHFKIIADHIRACVIAIQDGAIPSNVKRGYIIRRLIRRAYRSGIQLGIKDNAFLYQMVSIVAKTLTIYEIDLEKVAGIIKKEELSFAQTIKQGEEILNKKLAKTKEHFDFAIAFKLFETYGFPIEITQEILVEKGVKLDISKFAEYQKKHAQASKGQKLKGMSSQIQVIQEITEHCSEFVGYDSLEVKSKVIFSKKENDKAYTLLDKTSMYTEGGGQHSDYGTINNQVVQEVFKDKYGNIWHITDEVFNEEVIVMVDSLARKQKEANHSATHLLGAALRKVFCSDIRQLGSDNDEKRLRFDFPLPTRPENQKLVEVEKIVNAFINSKMNRQYIETSFAEGKSMGAITLEGESYGDVVRVVKFDDIIEFCGGTHVANSKSIEEFKIIKFESKGSGVFRIEAITTHDTIKKYNEETRFALIEEGQKIVDKIKNIDKDFTFDFDGGINTIEEQIISLRKKLKEISSKNNKQTINYDVDFTEFNNKKAYINTSLKPNEVKAHAIQLRDHYPDTLIIVGASVGDKNIVAVASNEFDAKVEFDALCKEYDGKGGGNENFAMGTMNKLNL